MEKILDRFSLGGIASVPDYRDITMDAVFGAPVPSELPPFYFSDITKIPVMHQRKIGACVGHASAVEKAQQELKETGGVLPFSPRFVYALAKAEDGLPAGLEGTYYRLGLKVLQKHGCATEATLPNDTTLGHEDYIFSRDTSKIPAAAFDEAKKYAIKSYAHVGFFMDIGEQQLKRAIMEGEGILLGMQVGKEWWSDKNGNPSWRAEDLLPIRPPASVVSGHAVFPYGWDTVNSRARFHIRNSWSAEWGDRGNGWFFHDEWKKYLTEAWAAVDLPNNWIEEARELPPAETFKHFFGFDLAFGQKSDEVRKLQIALKIDGTFPKSVGETGFYGEITRKAVLDFQKKYGVASFAELLLVNGRRVGAKTRRKLNELFNK